MNSRNSDLAGWSLFRFLKAYRDPLAIATVVLLIVSIMFGGASRDHALRLALTELAALPVLVIAGGRLARNADWGQHRFALTLLAGAIAIPLLQSIPLPPAIWTNLPGRNQMVLALELANLRPGWSPISATPDATWQAMLALLPPASIFLAIIASTPEVRASLIRVCLLAAAASVLLGMGQLASGGERLYPWATTSAGSVTGFFANRNHFATMLLAMIPFAMVIGAGSLHRRNPDTLPVWIAGLFIGLVIIALAAIRSRAGILLFAPVMLVSLIAAWIAAGRGRPGPGLLVLVGAIGVALAAVAVLALPPILARFETTGASDGRFDRWPLVAETATSYLPVGTGMGSFDAVYRSVEPLDELDATFFNQAHNDYLEIWMEAGWLAAGLLGAFLIWFGRRLWGAWKSAAAPHWDLHRASSIAVLVILVHSFVDYPLRTVTMSVIFAVCCGILEFSGRGGAGLTEPQRQRRRVKGERH